MADNRAHLVNRRRVLTFEDLPDDVLLVIFDLYVVRFHYLRFFRSMAYGFRPVIESWQSLVHVCRRWRSLTFGSSRHLGLQLYCCTRNKSGKKSLDVWPALPILIQHIVTEEFIDNHIFGLEHRIRLMDLNYDFRSIQTTTRRLLAAMQVPFPELEGLSLSRGSGGDDDDEPVVPDLFLGGSAPRLRFLQLHNVPFPGLPKLLLSSTRLVKLCLHKITNSWYISPEAMATCLSSLTNLKNLELEFINDSSRTGRKGRCPSPPVSVLPALKTFWFNGSVEYIEELVSRIDSPKLHRFKFSTLVQVFRDIDFKVPELNQFIGRTPTLGAYDDAAHLVFYTCKVLVRIYQSHPGPYQVGHKLVEVEISCREPNLQLLSLKTCTSSLRCLSTVENLYIDGEQDSDLIRDVGVGSDEWLDLLLPFTALKNLYLSKPLIPHIALALQKLIGGRIKEVLPALQSILLEGFEPSEPVQEGIAQFISARHNIDRPTHVISVWYYDYFIDYQDLP